MGICSSELFEGIRGRAYQSESGKLIRGCFHTVESDVALIQTKELEKLLSGVVEVVTSEPIITLEMIPEELKQRIIGEAVNQAIDNFIKENNITLKKSSEERKDIANANLSAARQSRQYSRRKNTAQALKHILNGNSISETSYLMDKSEGAISNLLKVGYKAEGTSSKTKYRKMTPEDAQEIWDEFRSTILSGVDIGLLATFKQCNCEYKAFRKKLAFDAEVERRHKVEKELERMELETKGREELTRIIDKAKEAGYIKAEPENKSDEGILEQVMALFEEAPSEPVIKQVKVDENDEKTAYFIEKYSGKGESVKNAEYNYFSPSRKRPKPKFEGAVVIPSLREDFHYEMEVDNLDE